MLIYLHEKISYPLENHQFFKNILVFISENKEIESWARTVGTRPNTIQWQVVSGRVVPAACTWH
jgi:hypothetical protein